MTVDTYVIGSNGKATIEKDPDAVLDYSWDWTAYLALVSDTIASVSYVLSAGLTSSLASHTTTVAKVFLSGGIIGTTESATCRIVTAGGRTDDRTIYLKMVAK
jgi:hypothetical protein